MKNIVLLTSICLPFFMSAQESLRDSAYMKKTDVTAIAYDTSQINNITKTTTESNTYTSDASIIAWATCKAPKATHYKLTVTHQPKDHSPIVAQNNWVRINHSDIKSDSTIMLTANISAKDWNSGTYYFRWVMRINGNDNDTISFFANRSVTLEEILIHDREVKIAVPAATRSAPAQLAATSKNKKHVSHRLKKQKYHKPSKAKRQRRTRMDRCKH